MNPDLPGPRCKELVDAGVMSWPCHLPLGHEGPHVAIEAPASERRREAWEQEQRAAVQPAAAVPDNPSEGDLLDMALGAPAEAPVRQVVLDANTINDEATRVAAILRLIRAEDVQKLPSPVASWVMGMLAQTSLIALLEMARREFDSGATGVVITPEYLERVVPPGLRSYLGRA